jgi:hypothetical protein
MRRPLSLYSPGGPMSGYDDPIRRSQSHRVLKSHQSEPLGPRYIERAAPSDASMYAPPPLAIATSPSGPEPVAYLSPGLEIVRASPTFIDAVGVPSVRGRSLFDIVAQSEGHKVQRLQVSMQEERGRKDPMYLPPIFGKDHEVRVFETLRYDAEELSRIPMDRHEVLVFVAADGQKRPFQVRLGSAKRDSIYFVALSLHIPAGFPYSTPSPHARDVPYNWPPQASMHSQQQPGPQQQQYAHPPPIHGGYDSGRRYGDASMQPRPGTAGPPPQIVTGLSAGVGAAAYSPGIVSGMSAYAASPSRPDYAIGSTSSQIPRSELPPAGRAPPPPQQHQQHYQLPPIRSSPQQGGGVQHEPPPRRDERSGRVDIGGLIDKPDQPPPSR